DESFLRTFLDYDSMLELNLFTYSKKKEAYTIDEISSTDGWKEVKEDLIKSVGMNGMPRMFVSELEKTGELLIEHEHDGRDLELNHAEAVVNHMTNIWGDMVKLKTIIEEELWEI
ncbi:MAG: stage V sporulation protein R, partial [Flavobacteriaceae bacterium]|nr:stage V sporulation protein R [Flavobacteriaceae bacterium]